MDLSSVTFASVVVKTHIPDLHWIACYFINNLFGFMCIEQEREKAGVSTWAEYFKVPSRGRKTAAKDGGREREREYLTNWMEVEVSMI